MKKFFKWLVGKSTKENPLDKDYTDDFRIKIIKLKSGITKYFPQYKSGIMDQWETLILVNDKGIGNIFISHQEMIETTISYCDSKEQSDLWIEKYKEQLIKQRSNEYLEEQILEI